jgi:hypothetical protein
LFACFVAVMVTCMSFAFGVRELRRSGLTTLETQIVMSSLIFRLALSLMLCLTLLLMLCLISLMDLTITHMILVHERTTLCLDALVAAPRFHHGYRFPRRPSFPAGGSHTHFESRYLDGPNFPHHGSHTTRSSDVVQKTMNTSLGRMVKC